MAGFERKAVKTKILYFLNQLAAKIVLLSGGTRQ